MKLSSFRIILIHGKTRFTLAAFACRNRTGEQFYRCSLQCLPLQNSIVAHYSVYLCRNSLFLPAPAGLVPLI